MENIHTDVRVQSVESNPELPWLRCTLLRDLYRKLALLSPPIIFKTKTNRKLLTRVFRRFNQFAYFYLELSLAPRYNFLAMIGYCHSFGFGFTKTTLS